MNTHEIMSHLSATARRILPDHGQAWLFGSRARGTANSHSDWDILVIIDNDHISNDDYNNYAHPFMELGWDLNECIIPIIYTKKQWDKMYFSPFYKNVMNDRIRL